MRISLTPTKLLLLGLFALLSNSSHADGDDGFFIDRWYNSHKPGVSAVQFKQYNEVCGRCHFAYQPGLLPAISWEKVMSNMDNHFGQPLQLTKVEQRTMMRYLLDNSAGHVNDEISNKILESLKYNPVPVRITETPYWKYAHRKVEASEIEHRAYQCQQCHQGASQGKYDTHNMNQSARHSMKLNSSDLIL